MVRFFQRLYKRYTKAKRRAAYVDYMRSAAWRKKRRERLAIAGERCEYRHGWWRCKATKRLHCHHVTYKRFGNEDVERDLLMLCPFHHSMVHGRRVSG